MPVESTERLAAAAFASNPVVDEAIGRIVAELNHARAAITAARPPQAERRETYETWLKRQEAVKGRPAWYPYVGSGMGHGPLVELLDGSVKWDMISGIGVHMFGHSDPDLVATALRGALSDTAMQGNLQFNADAIAFGELLVEEASKSSKLRHAFLVNAGALANESALKICYQKNAPADRVLAFENCFTGRTTTMAAITDSAGGRVGLPINTPVDYLPFFDPSRPEESIREAAWRLDQLLERHPGRHAVFAMELIQGEGGFNVAPREFFLPLVERCRAKGVGIWVDEVQTFGRTERMFYFQQLGLGDAVDVVTVGKMSQVCACLFTEAYNPKPGLLSATFIGSTVGLRVGRRLLERMLEGGYYGEQGRNAKLQRAFRARVDDLVRKHPDWFPPVKSPSPGAGDLPASGGVGGMMRFTPFGGKRDPVMKALRVMFEEGVIAFACGHGPYHVRFLPPVGVMTPEQFDDVFEIVERALAKVA